MRQERVLAVQGITLSRIQGQQNSQRHKGQNAKEFGDISLVHEVYEAV